jgi:hypothetical protein
VLKSKVIDSLKGLEISNCFIDALSFEILGLFFALEPVYLVVIFLISYPFDKAYCFIFSLIHRNPVNPISTPLFCSPCDVNTFLLCPRFVLGIMFPTSIIP